MKNKKAEPLKLTPEQETKLVEGARFAHAKPASKFRDELNEAVDEKLRARLMREEGKVED
jgi:hypothetical protein